MNSAAATRPMWSNEQEVMLIEYYAQHPELWNMKNSGYTKTVNNNAVLDHLSSMLGDPDVYSVKEIKRKFHSLRTVFLREFKRLDHAQRSAIPCQITWRHFDRMMFLRDVSVTLQTLGRYSPEFDAEAGEEQRVVKIEQNGGSGGSLLLDEDEQQHASPMSEEVVHQEPQSKRARKHNATAPNDYNVSGPVDLWAAWLSTELQQLEPMVRDVARVEIQNLIIRLKYGSTILPDDAPVEDSQ